MASIPISRLVVDQPNFTCNLQLLTLKKQGVIDRQSAVLVGSVDFKQTDLYDQHLNVIKEPKILFDTDRKRKSS